MMRTPSIHRHTLHLSALGLVLLVASNAGCQGWWNRSKTQSLLGFTKETQETDDWEHPNAPSDRDSKVAPNYNSLAKPSILENAGMEDKPYRVTLPRDRQKELAQAKGKNPDLADLPNPKTAALDAPPTATPKSPAQDSAVATSAVATSAVNTEITTAQTNNETKSEPTASDQNNGVSQASATTPIPVTPPSASPNPILDSGLSEVDIEGALALLPADYQSVLRKKISGQKISGQTDADQKTIESTTKEIGRLGQSADQDPKNPSRWSHELNQSVVALEKYLEAGSDLEPAIRQHQEMTLRLLYLAQRNLESAKRPIQGANPREQEYLDHQLTALFQATNPDANPSRPRHWAQVAAEQKLADRQLSALSNLLVSPPVFCTQVDGFGATHKFDKNCFKPEQQVLLYCELEHVTSQRVREGYESRIRGTYEIRDSQGKRIVEQSLPMEPDVCASQRRDYFLVYMIYMPPNIESGKYELVLSMEDLTGNKFGTSKSEFEIKK
jgi:hypothetical protein